MRRGATEERLRRGVLSPCGVAPDAGARGVRGGGVDRGLGIVEALEGKGKRLLDHGRVPSEKKAETRLGQLTCDLFLTGTNAVTLDGCLVNLGMNGNRTNAMTFGPKKTVVVAGGQKVVSDVGEALRRIKAVAAPRNTKRLKLSTPGATSGFCADWDSPPRICRASPRMIAGFLAGSYLTASYTVGLPDLLLKRLFGGVLIVMGVIYILT